MGFEDKLRDVNQRLKEQRVKVSIERRGNRLWLRATLPPKPGKAKTEPHQQKVSTGLPAHLAGLREAERRAKLLDAQRINREFSWDEWSKPDQSVERSCGEWVEAFEKHYLDQGGQHSTWQGDYWKALKHLPSSAILTPDVLEAMVLNTEANTRSRQRAAMAAGALAKYAAIEFDGSQFRGNYSPTKVSPRDLPEDDVIARHREQISNPAWRWVYGVMATYGLRNHEVFYLDLSEFPVLRVLEDTKTGGHEVWPCYPEWAEQWRLDERILPPVDTARTNEKIGHSVTKYLSPKLPFQPYDLRHAWAIRTLLFGWPVELSARQMGHSVEVHTRTYQQWISRDQMQRVYDLLVNRNDRPRPPSP